MLSFKAKFDGEKIHVPPGLHGHEPCDVEILVSPVGSHSVEGETTPTDEANLAAFWDFINNNPNPKTDEQVRKHLKELQEGRDECD